MFVYAGHQPGNMDHQIGVNVSSAPANQGFRTYILNYTGKIKTASGHAYPFSNKYNWFKNILSKRTVMQIEVIRTPEDLQPLADEWNELLSQSATNVPFLRHEY
jgi:hypothetical protein